MLPVAAKRSRSRSRAARHGHAAPRHLDATGHAAARGWTADPGAARIPCFVPAASSAALRQRSGDTTGAPGPTPFSTVDTPPVPFTTKVVAGAVPLREPSRGSFRPLRL
jgi:hypothetical protein